MRRPESLILLGSALLVLAAPAPASPNREPELGLVHWNRSPERALAASKRAAKPVFMLFDEVPGCATCRGFGQDVLSNPLLVEAIEQEFVPVFVANNRPGSDAEWLARYGEPAWNNPVVRLLTSDGRDLLPRRDGLYSAPEIASRMIDALRAAHRVVPGYLELVAQETRLAGRASCVFATACYWEGEALLGSVSGVVAVQALDTSEGEAVRVTYDAKRLSHETLTQIAEKHGYARELDPSVTQREAHARDHLRALARSPLRALELTPLQAVRVNAALATGGDGREWLTPTQREQAGLTSAGTAARPMTGSNCPAPGH